LVDTLVSWIERPGVGNKAEVVAENLKHNCYYGSGLSAQASRTSFHHTMKSRRSRSARAAATPSLAGQRAASFSESVKRSEREHLLERRYASGSCQGDDDEEIFENNTYLSQDERMRQPPRPNMGRGGGQYSSMSWTAVRPGSPYRSQEEHITYELAEGLDPFLSLTGACVVND
jgi:hypothetical protein